MVTLLSLKSGKGPQFILEELGEYCIKSGIYQCLVTLRWPEADDQVERQKRSTTRRIQISHNSEVDYEDALMAWLFIYRNTPHSITGRSPSKRLLGRTAKTKLPCVPSLFKDSEACDRD